MNWLNLNVQTLDSEEFVGSEPVARATWLCLLRYCIGQENGGRIEGCREWPDRKWQQVVRITREEATSDSDLWKWDADALVVWEYPVAAENEVVAKRAGGRNGGKATTPAKAEAAKANGRKGGRPKKTQAETQAEPKQQPNEKERKGKEGEGEENAKIITITPSSSAAETAAVRPPTFAEVQAFAASTPMGITAECVAGFFDEMEAVQWTYKGQSLVVKSAWHARFRKWTTNWVNNEAGARRAAK